MPGAQAVSHNLPHRPLLRLHGTAYVCKSTHAPRTLTLLQASAHQFNLRAAVGLIR